MEDFPGKQKKEESRVMIIRPYSIELSAQIFFLVYVCWDVLEL